MLGSFTYGWEPGHRTSHLAKVHTFIYFTKVLVLTRDSRAIHQALLEVDLTDWGSLSTFYTQHNPSKFPYNNAMRYYTSPTNLIDLQ